MTSRHVTRLAVPAALLVAIAAPSAPAAVPQPGATFTVHDHAERGDGWHVELTVSDDSRTVRQLVLHEERCEATVLASDLPIRGDEGIDASKPFESRGRRGTWSLRARFRDPTHLEGSFTVSAGDCQGPPRPFEAHAEGHHDDGHAGHGHHHHHLSGTPPGRYPDLGGATPARLAQARRLWRSSLRTARTRYATYDRARRLGFVKMKLPPRRPRLFHLRHSGYAADRHAFDARRPESLVYWLPPQRGRPVLIAYMYRVAKAGRPRFAAPLLGWHSHGAGDTQMTHVWLTHTLETALANCMPVAALEAAIPRYRYDPAGRPRSPESIPCPEEASR